MLKINKPTLLLDTEKCRSNITRMAQKADKSGVVFRPHFKTHQSLEVGKIFKEYGVNRITVSSLQMAEYFSVEWDDITVAFPVNIRDIDTINKLAQRITLNLCVENIEATAYLAEHLSSKVNIFLKIDVGYHRTGIDPNNISLIQEILDISDHSDKLNFAGFLGHAGHTYKCISKEEILAIQKESVAIMQGLKSVFDKKYPNLIISLGDTPGCSISDSFDEIDEIRPGNFVFYDLTQEQIGSCTIDQIAVVMACPVVAIHKQRNEIVIHGGGVHFSKEQLQLNNYGAIYGQVVEKDGDKWGGRIPDMYVKALSQEHGIIAAPTDYLDMIKIGDILYILPVHSCMTANLMKEYLTTDGYLIRL